MWGTSRLGGHTMGDQPETNNNEQASRQASGSVEPWSDSPTVDSDSARQLSDSPTVPTVRQSDSPRQLSDSVRQCFLWHHAQALSDGPTVRPTVPTVPTVLIFSDSSDSFQQFQECRPCQQPWTHKNQRRCVNNFAKMSRISRTTHHCCGFRLAALETCS